MAIYYWLGVTGACGNVNNPANWTLWAPGSCGFLPPAAVTGPQYNDSIQFARYNVSGACYGVSYYPQVAPQGQMYGRTGPASKQNFVNVKVLDECPVGLGASGAYFKFNADNLELRIGTDNVQPAGAESYIDLGKEAGRPAYCYVDINAAKLHTYRIKGQVSSISAVTISRQSNSIIDLKDLEFAQARPHSIMIHSILPNGPICNDQVYLYDTTTGYNGFYASGNGKVFIYPGYSQSLDTMILGTIDGAFTPTANTLLQFASSDYDGACGPNDALTRTYINELNLKGNKQTNTVYVNHGVDFINLKMQGGSINFNQTSDINPSVVQKGYMYGATSKITATNPTVAIGSNGDFTLLDNNTTNTYIPDISLKGNWIMDLNPGAVGVCGPN